MISVWLGGVGSGKTACLVRELKINRSHRRTFSNIQTTKLKNNRVINREMIIKKEVVGQKKNGDDIEKLELNVEFWKELQAEGEPINVVIDEAHTLMNPRRAMSKINVIMTDFMALLRRVLGESESGYGQLILMTQLRRRLDPIAREMATQFRYHVCHFQKICKKCNYTWKETNENPEPCFECPSCGSHKLLKCNHMIEVWCFKGEESYMAWKEYSAKSYYRHFYVTDIEEYFPYYNTLQWDNLISEY